ncbi:MAG: MBL fold metallo-hydrolase [Oscillospiraceae bacterium]|nr:MBL fold metallo-hydrolase [Oscillospiraceae bacterium]
MMKVAINARKIFLMCMALCFSITVLLDGLYALAVSGSAPSTEMSIHAIRFGDESGTEDKDLDGGGDAVLLESKGKYLMMDTGSPGFWGAIQAYLKKLKVGNLDIYLSHMHKDHYGNLLNMVSNYKIGCVYLPDTNYGKKRTLGDGQSDIARKVQQISPSTEVKYLKTGNFITVGDTRIDIIGPVKTGFGGRESTAVNNESLVAMVTCGKTRFLTAGDIEGEGEASLIKTIGKARLKADIMKLSHHGIVSTSNSEAFINAVAPQYSFVQNAKIAKIQTGGYRRSYTCRKRANEHGICVSPDDEEKDIVFKVVNDKITMHLDGVALKNGWNTVQGGDGINQKTDKFYFDVKTGQFKKGIQKIGGKMYDFGTSGCMKTGGWIGKKYLYLKYSGKKNEDFRFYEESGAFKTGLVYLRKKQTGQNSNRWVYFNHKTGYAYRGKNKSPSKYSFFTIKGKKYMINGRGTVYTYGWQRVSKGPGLRYFNKKGIMKTGWFAYKTADGRKYKCYLNKKTGLRVIGFRKIGKYVYYFYPDSGALRTGGTIDYKGKKYMPDGKGRVRRANGGFVKKAPK